MAFGRVQASVGRCAGIPLIKPKTSVELSTRVRRPTTTSCRPVPSLPVLPHFERTRAVGSGGEPADDLDSLGCPHP